jgi:hypothetical protein
MRNFIKPVRTLVFNVFGTVVDRRTPIIEAVTAAANETAADGDWSALGPQFATDWKAAYRPAMERVNEGGPWINVDAIMRQRLDEIAGQYGLDGLSAARLDTLNEAWSLARLGFGAFEVAQKVRSGNAFQLHLPLVGGNGQGRRIAVRCHYDIGTGRALQACARNL